MIVKMTMSEQACIDALVLEKRWQACGPAFKMVVQYCKNILVRASTHRCTFMCYHFETYPP